MRTLNRPQIDLIRAGGPTLRLPISCRFVQLTGGPNARLVLVFGVRLTVNSTDAEHAATRFPASSHVTRPAELVAVYTSGAGNRTASSDADRAVLDGTGDDTPCVVQPISLNVGQHLLALPAPGTA